MKRFMLLITALFVGIIMLLALSYNTNAQIDSCLELILPHDPENGILNPDSVMVDTCNNSMRLFAKKYFDITFKNSVFEMIEYNRDTLIIKNWRDIYPNYANVRSICEQLENLYGQYNFIRKFPDIIDTERIASRTYYISFNNYVPIDSIIPFFSDTTLFYSIQYLHDYGKQCSVPESQEPPSSRDGFSASPNPATDYIVITGFNLPSNRLVEEKIRIYNALGEIALAAGAIHELPLRIDVSGLQPGVYFIRAGNNSMKFIKL